MKQLALLVVAGVLSMTACAGGSGDNESSASSETSSPSSSARATTPRTTTPRSTTPPPPPPAFTFDCYETTYSGPVPTYTSLEEVWSSGKQFSACSVEVSPSYTATPTDLAAVALYQQFVPSETVTGGLTTMLGICADTTVTEDEILRWQSVVVQGALLLCPSAPHAGVMQPRASGDVINDGTYVVGQTIKPGTWVTAPGARDCYWERTDGGGNTIDNNFISFAPDGATVTVRPR